MSRCFPFPPSGYEMKPAVMEELEKRKHAIAEKEKRKLKKEREKEENNKTQRRRLSEEHDGSPISVLKLCGSSDNTENTRKRKMPCPTVEGSHDRAAVDFGKLSFSKITSLSETQLRCIIDNCVPLGDMETDFDDNIDWLFQAPSRRKSKVPRIDCDLPNNHIYALPIW